MRFVKTASPDTVVDYLARTLQSRLEAEEQVLWLAAGGSVIQLAVEVAHRLHGRPLSRLTVSLIDERYGPVGHADSIWQQLLEAGFDLPGATLLPVLTGTDRDATAAAWGAALRSQLPTPGYKLGLLGLGPDGHIAGILPHSPAVDAISTTFAYRSEAIPGVRPPFERITITVPTIARLDEAVVYAIGEAKWPVLDELATQQPLDRQPAQALKAVPKLTVFNDHIGEQA